MSSVHLKLGSSAHWIDFSRRTNGDGDDVRETKKDSIQTEPQKENDASDEGGTHA